MGTQSLDQCEHGRALVWKAVRFFSERTIKLLQGQTGLIFAALKNHVEASGFYVYFLWGLKSKKRL